MPFVTSVVSTYASWRAEFAAEVCPTSAPYENSKLHEVDVTSEVLDCAETSEVGATYARYEHPFRRFERCDRRHLSQSRLPSCEHAA